jgi:hypothetical protein
MNALKILQKHNCNYLLFYKWCKSNGFDEDVSREALVELAQRLENNELVDKEAASKLSIIVTRLQEGKLEMSMTQDEEEKGHLGDLLQAKKIEPKKKWYNPATWRE